MSDPFSDIGPALPPRHAVYDMARWVRLHAEFAQELVIAGARCDVGRSLTELRRVRDEVTAFLVKIDGED